MSDRPPPRGRGAALREALLRKKAEEEKQVGIQQETLVVEEPPKPKGRAAFLKQLHDSRLKKVGVAVSNIAPVFIETKTSTVTEQSSLKVHVEEELNDVLKSVSLLDITERDPVTFRGKCSYSI